GVVRAELVTGTGLRLDQLRTEDRTSESTPQDEWIAEAVGALASTGRGDGLQQQLGDHGVGFVLLRSTEGGDDDVERARLQSSLDQQTALSSAGQTDHGLLWRLQGEVSQTDGEEVQSVSSPLEGTTLSGLTVWWVQIVVLLGMLLLALPTGEVVERPERRRKGGGSSAALKAAAATPSASAVGGPAYEPVVEAADVDPADIDPANIDPADAGPAASDPADSVSADSVSADSESADPADDSPPEGAPGPETPAEPGSERPEGGDR
ncbi:MAG: glycosyl transferase, partial [Solirubrobacteraceae bacterium]